jgi:uncharacterized protein YyaL (SSP411 family)
MMSASARPRPAGAALALALLLGASGCRRSPPEPPMPPPPSPEAAAPARRFATHPETLPYPPALDAALAAAAARLPADYRPRTRHVDGRELRSAARHPDPYAPPGAKPNYTGRLLLETSPYLRQHAHNPVDWRPWGPEAFAEARRLGRPIFLSIGYATCHWCHVMEHESFEDLAIAAQLNARYVPIKVDREERPDVDAVYMAAVQALSGSGGWPMSVWIAPGEGGPGREVVGLPFFAGTYFPPRGGMRGRPGFADLLTRFADAYAEDRAGIVAQGERVAAHVRARLTARHGGALPGLEVVDRYAAQLHGAFDATWGGTLRAPKFPSNVPVSLLLAHHLRRGDPLSRRMALFSLDQMSRGGIYDHVGGGFARYSTDARWLVPHFEKMLYDQALIGRALVDAVALEPTPQRLRTLRQTIDYLLRELRAPTGAFYSATDADSEGEEGRFFVWTPAELAAALGPAEAALLAEIYGVTAGGNFEGRSILHLRRALEDEAAARGEPAEAFVARVRASLDALYAVRARRAPPLLDDKVLASWNGLTISALARAGWQLAEPRYVAAAEAAAAFLAEAMSDGRGGLWRVAMGDPRAGGAARVAGQLDDYAFVIAGLIDLAQATSAPRWLRLALALQDRLDRDFAAEGGGYYATAAGAEPLLAREMPDYDGAEPSGNAIAAQNLLRLGALLGDRALTARGEATIAAFAGRLTQTPAAMPELLYALEMARAPLREVVLVRPEGSGPEALAPLGDALRGAYLPHRVVLEAAEGAPLRTLAEVTPLARDKVARGGRPTAYVCQGGVCQLPTDDPAVMLAQLRAGQAPPPSEE